MGRLIPYCVLALYWDSLRIYFNKGEPDERYVTYTKKAFKPRDIRNPDEYIFEKLDDWHVDFYYTFTDEDYEHAISNQNATPTPIRRCSIVYRDNEVIRFEDPRCLEEGGTICWKW